MAIPDHDERGSMQSARVSVIDSANSERAADERVPIFPSRPPCRTRNAVMLKDVVIAFGLALLWWFTGIPMSLPAGAALPDSSHGNEG
jgi:hypothetical protein